MQLKLHAVENLAAWSRGNAVSVCVIGEGCHTHGHRFVRGRKVENLLHRK